MKLAKWACYLLLLIGIVGGVGKMLEGDTNIGIQLMIFCGIVAGLGLIFIHFCLHLFGDVKKNDK